MENKKLKYEHEVFIKEMIAHGDKNRAYRAAYPETTSNIYNSARRLVNQPQIKALIEEGQQQKKLEAEEHLQEEYYLEMISIERKRALLSRILNGEMTFEKLGYGPTGSKLITTPPNIGELCRVIDTDTRLAKEAGVLKQKLPKKFFIDGKELK